MKTQRSKFKDLEKTKEYKKKKKKGDNLTVSSDPL